ncbi:hypothetical protein P171DRAFT_515301 [Karstenula rhodostoma CBS 690.94]|uniref:Uncharacterized protein n=1 Tax=Karstenula rhodostoma CBS 690.94 TaxID=1392251 RepID=A0A9P4UIJ6_9PLEO|nr:hypothetical protein P171DRAFT_515301 [Karstenula rhodostoma CBS 690.94]
MRIRDDSFNVSMLTLEDYDIDVSTQIGLPDLEYSTRTSLMCVELAKLCVCIGHVFSSQYTDLETQADVPPNMMIVPKRPESSATRLNSYDEEIANWYQAFLSTFNRFDSPPKMQNGMHPCSEAHCTVDVTFIGTIDIVADVPTMLHFMRAVYVEKVGELDQSYCKSLSRKKAARHPVTSHRHPNRATSQHLHELWSPAPIYQPPMGRQAFGLTSSFVARGWMEGR